MFILNLSILYMHNKFNPRGIMSGGDYADESLIYFKLHSYSLFKFSLSPDDKCAKLRLFQNYLQYKTEQWV